MGRVGWHNEVRGVENLEKKVENLEKKVEKLDFYFCKREKGRNFREKWWKYRYIFVDIYYQVFC